MRQIFNQLCQRVQQDVERFTGLEVVDIKVHINDVMSKTGMAGTSILVNQIQQLTLILKLNR
nr:Asp23/Gls24 family envelope stress response protein [Levilactobacillus brevis]